MAEAQFQYSEAFLQWIWENGLFDHAGLQTDCGKSVQILEVGELNKTNGPDFKACRIAIDELTWHGDVELHLRSKDWYAHGHHVDENFNSVFLHVIVGGNNESVKTQNGSSPYTLNLEPYLSSNLKVFLKSFEDEKTLPCTGNMNFISEKVFIKQLEKAHSEYLEKKTDDFLSLYDPNILPSAAWKKALALSVWDGLGITHNRKAMKVTGERLLASWDGVLIDEGIELALNEAGLTDNSDIKWNLKSVRPANHPEKRIHEAVLITFEILNTPFENFLGRNSVGLWSKWCKSSDLKSSSRMKILFGTVFLPGLYVLGMLFAHEYLKDKVRTTWSDLKTPIPQTLLKKFKALPIKTENYSKKLGSIHQLKSYCKPRMCSECFVLKNAIQS
ncbi:DUF2851 family protein [Gracilimonas sp. Q87]|uniref:DUF2851 family protein n=1 Tax=Gracilimonas sp. Q87 TaxID=3384766 RepID=UPI0039841337